MSVVKMQNEKFSDNCQVRQLSRSLSSSPPHLDHFLSVPQKSQIPLHTPIQHPNFPSQNRPQNRMPTPNIGQLPVSGQARVQQKPFLNQGSPGKQHLSATTQVRGNNFKRKHERYEEEEMFYYNFLIVVK